MTETNAKVKFFSYDLLKVGGIAAFWYITIFTGFSNFFIQFGISPIDTIAKMIGGLIIPVIPSYFFAKYFYKNKQKPFLLYWISGTVALCAISTIGLISQLR